MGRPKTELVLTDDERSQLQSFARSRSLPSALSDRARIVLSSADGEANNSIAQRLKLTWRRLPARIAAIPASRHRSDEMRLMSRSTQSR